MLFPNPSVKGKPLILDKFYLLKGAIYEQHNEITNIKFQK